jgi:hypothetical protein
MSTGRPLAGTVLAAVTLALGLAGCSPDLAGAPTAPSPGPLSSGGGAGPVVAPPTSEGPGLTAPGIRMSVVPKGDGTFDVTEEVMLRDPTSTLTLRPPQSGERLVGMMTKTKPVASSLQVTADDELQTVDDPKVTQARDLQLVAPATKLRLTYRLSGSTVRSIPSEAGRAASALSPLTAATDGTLPTNIVVSGGGLLNAMCPQLTEPRCAVGEPPGMGVQQGIPADRALAVLQLNLPMQP